MHCRRQVCDRGGNGRAEKSAAVKAAGGVGVVLLNTEITSTSSDLHAVPTVHLDANVRDTIRAYAATENATATLPPSQLTENALAPQMAGFSSRGPLTTGGGLLLKPDITAPGAGKPFCSALASCDGHMHALQRPHPHAHSRTPC